MTLTNDSGRLTARARRSSARTTTAFLTKKSECCSLILIEAASRSYSCAPVPKAPIRAVPEAIAGVSITGIRQIRYSAPPATEIARR